MYKYSATSAVRNYSVSRIGSRIGSTIGGSDRGSDRIPKMDLDLDRIDSKRRIGSCPEYRLQKCRETRFDFPAQQQHAEGEDEQLTLISVCQGCSWGTWGSQRRSFPPPLIWICFFFFKTPLLTAIFFAQTRSLLCVGVGCLQHPVEVCISGRNGL